MTYTPTEAELESLGFDLVKDGDYSDDRWQHHYVGCYMWLNGAKYDKFINYDPIADEWDIGCWGDRWTQIKIQSLEDIKTLIKLLTPP